MAWTEIKFEKIYHNNEIYKLSLMDTGFNILLQFYWFENDSVYNNEREGYRIFFGVNYWPYIMCSLKNLDNEENINYVKWGNKRIKIELLKDIFILSRQASDKAGGTWTTEIDDEKRRGSSEKTIRIPKELVDRIIEVSDSFMEDSRDFPVKASDFDPYFPDQMINHDKSMIAFKVFLEKNENLKMFVKAGIDPSNKEEYIKKIKFYTDDMKKDFKQRQYKKIEPYHRAMIKIWETKQERAEFSEKILEEGLGGTMGDDRGDDGYIELISGKKRYTINFDWEIRNDWVKNYLNVPIYFNRRNFNKKTPAYCTKSHIALAPAVPNNSYRENIEEVEALIQNSKGAPEPYFLYDSMGQFQRKIDKPQIMLSIQCSNIAPLWPEMKKIPHGGHFIVAWHEDFGDKERVIRTASSGSFEKNAEMSQTVDFGIFEFNENGVKKFSEILKKQYSIGDIQDRHGNKIPKVRKWT